VREADFEPLLDLSIRVLRPDLERPHLGVAPAGD
jgi:hypothetical protein